VQELARRVVVGLKEGETDPAGKSTESAIRNFLGMEVDSVKTRRVYTTNAALADSEFDLLKRELFVDPEIEMVVEDPAAEPGFDWLIEVGYRPGVTDNVGNTGKNTAIPYVIGRRLGEREGVYTSTQYLINGRELKIGDVKKIGTELLANPVIETIRVLSRDEVREHGIPLNLPTIEGSHKARVNVYDLKVSDAELVNISKKGVLSLSLEEMRKIRAYFGREDVIAKRKRIGMEKRFWANPTDVEMEVLAQTWSEHCKHKIFNADIAYRDGDAREEELIKSLFNTCIKTPSNAIGEEWGWVASSFHDNAGVVRFNDGIFVVDKIETHNSPSALDPYGGAITGIVGVNRDPMGTGKGASLMANIFGYCFGDPFYGEKLPAGVLHPKRLRDGVHKGVIDGGNQSGIPLAYWQEFFDGRYTTRPLVYCGTIGTMPVTINGEPAEFKKADHGDAIIMVGGRIGKDGIHGATFSSAELDKESPVQAVQIGDPITQKKMSDLLLEARGLGLYKCITDNGAGGLSSSVGEMAESSNGCNFDLKKAPLKYEGLDPWEIMVSEAQERMTVAVDPRKTNEFLKLAERRGVEATVLGNYEDSGVFHATYGGKLVAHIDLEFLHNGVPRMELRAEWKRPVHEEPDFEQPADMNKTLEEMLARLNICSKEGKLRQYDHEVKGLSVIKPLVGKDCDVPSDATVMFLEYGSKEGLAIASGLNPHYSEIDTYEMAASVIDEALRKIIAVGGKLPSEKTPVYGLDNFCWNISDLNSEDGRIKIAQLVRANKALAYYCEAFKVPCISGKDSMKNVWKIKEVVDGKETEKIVSIPPTLLFSARGKIDDVSKCVTMDVKKPGDLVYVVGETRGELGASEYYSYIGEKFRGERYIGNNVPGVDAESAKEIYGRVGEVTEREIAHSIHTPTLGGLAVALAQSAFAGGYGMDVDLGMVPYDGEKKRDDTVLFSQSNSRFIVTVPPERKGEFESLMAGTACSQIGVVTYDKRLKVKGLGGSYIIDSDTGRLKEAWKATMGDLL